MNIGILGLGKIAVRAANGVVHASNATLYAVASRDKQKAEAFCERSGACVSYGSYEEMLQDEQVELVYICTPNHLHYDHIMLCLKHGKHVICEKPMVLKRIQLEKCFAYAKQQNCFLMEAEKTLFTPLNQKLKRLVEEGAIGKLQYIEAGYCAHMELDQLPSDSWLFRKDESGSFVDVGVYPICYANFFAEAALSQVQVMKKCIPAGIDVLTQGMLGYENGVMAYVRSSWSTRMENVGYLYGDQGMIKTENFWKNTKAVLIADGKETILEVEMESDFTGEIEHAVSCIQQGLLESPVLSERKSSEILKVLEEMQTCNCVSEEKSVK